MLDAFNTFISGCHILEREEYINDLGKAENMVSRKDAPVLAAAMHPDVEYLLTSDKELQNIDTRKVKVLDVKQARELFL
jgi:predicted nucleic acid-binding protein